jgi:hypothetical protein
MPLIGAQGPGSNISWRGNLDEYPDFFEFPQILEVGIGSAVTSATQTITGINYKALVTAVGSGASVSINGAVFVDGNDENNPIIIRNNDTVAIQIRTEDNQTRFDYNKTYNADVTIGKRSASWFIRTLSLDDTPDLFSFTSSLNNEVSVARTSNEVTVTGIDNAIGVDILVTSPTGSLFVNGVDSGRSARILDGGRLYLRDTTSGFYNTTGTVEIVLGSFETSWTLGTRVADKTPDAFNLGSVTNVGANTIQISNTITVTGADPNVNGNNPLEASITGADGEFKVIRNGIEIRGYSPNPFTVQNGDQITVKAVASQLFETTILSTLTIGETSGNFSIRTRVAPIKTFPGEFNFRDVTGVQRTNTLTPPENRIDSEPITLRQMSNAPNDFGTASITGNGGDSSPAQFKVIRNGVTVRDFSSANFQVRDDDQIVLRIISSPNSLGTVQATFTVTGIDTTNVLAGVAGSTSDTWIVTSARRVCTLSTFSFAEEKEATPNVTYSRTFVAQGFDKDCGCTVTTSDTANSFLQIGDVTGTSLNVKPGDTVTVSLTCPYFDSTRSTTVTLTSSFGTQRTAVFTVTPKAPPLPELTIDANPRNPEFVFPVGGSTVLTYSYDFVTNPNVTTNFGVTTVTTPRGTATSSRSNLTETITYTITVSNSTGSTTKSIQVLVGSPPTPTLSLCPSDTANCPIKSNVRFGDPVTLFWKSSFATSVTSTDFTTNNLQSGSVTFTPNQDNKVYSISATGPGGTVTATQQINLTPRVTISVNPTTITNGGFATLFWSSDLATRVVTTNGFSASTVTGFALVNPTVTTTYSITVTDDEGFTDTASVRLNVEDDRIVDAFFFNPPSFTDRQTGEVVTSEPSFIGGGNFVSGLSPNVSVTATVSGTGAQFSSGGTSINVQNGTPTSSLRVSLQNSSQQDQQRTATLTIGTQSASFTTRTRQCTVEESTGTIDNAITINLRRSPGLNDSVAYNFSGGSSTVQRQSAASGERIFSNPGAFNFTVPNGVTQVTVEAVGGGGGAYSGRDCTVRTMGVGGGGGGATSTSVSVVGGNQFSGTVGSAGGGSSDGSSGGFTSTGRAPERSLITARRLANLPPFNSPANPLNLPRPVVPPPPVSPPPRPVATPPPVFVPPVFQPQFQPVFQPVFQPQFQPVFQPVFVAPPPPPEYRGTMTQSTCSVSPGNGSVNISAQNCGRTLPTDCDQDRSLRYYRITWPPFPGATLRVTSASPNPAGGLGGEGSPGNSLQYVEPDGDGAARIWFCRTTGGGGTTHVADFTYTITAPGGGFAPTPRPVAPTVPNNVRGGNGGNTIVNYQSNQIINVGGGIGGGWSGNVRSFGSGGSPNGGSANSDGGGGGSGKVNGGTNPSGSSYQGGTGEIFNGNTASGQNGSPDPGCTKAGGFGGGYGAGGGAGSGPFGIGGSGSSGAVRFSWSLPQAQSVTYSQLISEILRTYWSKGNRGPTLSELQAEVNKFKNDSVTYATIANLTDSISIPNIGSTPPNDNCGNPIPRFT